MNTFFNTRWTKSTFRSAVAVLGLLASANLHAGIVDSTGLLTVGANNVLRSYKFDGTPVATLPITGLSPVLSATGVAGTAT